MTLRRLDMVFYAAYLVLVLIAYLAGQQSMRQRSQFHDAFNVGGTVEPGGKGEGERRPWKTDNPLYNRTKQEQGA